GADAQDDSLSVSVVFDLDDMNTNVVDEMAAARAALVASEAQDPKATADEPAVEVGQEELPADVEEPSLSVSVVFEPDDLPPQLLEGVPSPIEDAPAAADDVPASDAPHTIADGGLEAAA